MRISLRSNGVPVMATYSGMSSTFNSVSGGATLQLDVDDLVYLYVEKGEIYESNKANRAFTVFTGFQVSNTRSRGMLSGLLGRNMPQPSISLQTVLEKDENDKILTLVKHDVKETTDVSD